MRSMMFTAALFSAAVAQAGVVAFPGAEGFGAGATGGRGGDVYHVTTLEDSGPGSLRDAVSAPNRTVVFDVGGRIDLKSQIPFSDNLTIAGQTAPGGITLFGAGISLSNHTNVIVRYLTIRSGIKSGRGSKSFNISDGSNIIADHLSFGWGRWDNGGITGKSHDVTVQNCLIHEAIKGQQFGMIVDGARRLSLLRNLWANNHGRNPKGKGDLQYINNVIYNWGNQGYGGGHSGAPWNQDLIGNYMIAGPDSNEKFFSFLTANDLIHSSGNFVDLDKDGTLNGRPWTEDDVKKQAATPATKPFNESPFPVTITSAEQAVADVIKGVGNSLHRDAVDQRQIDQLKSFGTLGKNPEDEDAVGGNPATAPAVAAPADDDRDGIPNDWETAHGLDPKNPEDGKQLTPAGYTQLEVYLNSLVPAR